MGMRDQVRFLKSLAERPRMTGAIHIYGGDFFAVPRSEWDSETLRERPMDIGALQKRFDEANQRFKGKS